MTQKAACGGLRTFNSDHLLASLGRAVNPFLPRYFLRDRSTPPLHAERLHLLRASTPDLAGPGDNTVAGYRKFFCKTDLPTMAIMNTFENSNGTSSTAKQTPFARSATLLILLAFISIGVLAADAAPRKKAQQLVSYLIQPGDVLFVSVWREESLQREVLVGPDGSFNFPLAGEVNARGLTTTQLEFEISNKLKKFIPEPVVTVNLARNLGNRIYVVGKVNNPGEYIVARSIDVIQAIALAGGMTPFADKDKIKVLRRKNGRQETFAFDYSQVEKGRLLSQNITLIPGDTVVVP